MVQVISVKYEYSEEWTLKALELAEKLGYRHIVKDRVACIKSRGSKTRRTIARIHALGKVMQLGMKQQPFYTIELISEKFDRQSQDEKLKTIIHELMHIPHSFGGGFRHHRPFVNRKTVDREWERLGKQTGIE